MRTLSLRTEALSEAMVRASRLGCVLDAAWERLEMQMTTSRSVTAASIDQVIDELLVRELARIITEHEQGLARTREEADAALARMMAERAALREEARRRDYERAKSIAVEVSASLGYAMSAEATVRQTLYAQTFNALRKVNDAELAVETGSTVDDAASEANIPPTAVSGARQAVRGQRITVAQAFDAAVAHEPSSDNRHHILSAKRVALAFWGDAPISTIGRDEFIGLLLFARRLPVDHGRRHGKNAHAKQGLEIGKHDEIARADRHDAELRAGLEAMNLPVREREARLQAGLTPRLNEKTIKKIHSFVRRAFKAARVHLDYAGAELPTVLEEFRARGKAAAEREYAAGADIVQRKRQRSSWSDERLQTLFNSPLYRGHTPKRRHQPGVHLTRDAIYWTPLIAAATGMRPEEILQRLKSDVVKRNGVHAFHVRQGPGTRVKTPAGERYVPVPDVLLRLGFIEWVNDKRREPGLFLFDEIEVAEASTRLSGIFGGRFTSIRKALDIADESEDFYALRRTFNSRLTAQDVKPGDCAALLGHKQKDITNIHYTDRELPRLKTLMDRIDYRFEIAPTSRFGFPVLVACRLDEREKVDILIDHYDDGNPRLISVRIAGASLTIGVAPLASWPCFSNACPPDGAMEPEAAAEALIKTLGDRAPRFREPNDAATWEQLMSHALVEDW